MTDFKREERYVVIKLKDIDDEQRRDLSETLNASEIPTRECVVIEKRWPIYEAAWKLIEGLVKSNEK